MSVFEWQNGAPSIFSSLQKQAAMVRSGPPEDAAIRKERAVRVRKDPVNLPKKPKNRDGSGKTKPLAARLDLEKVREYRLSGKTWQECAEKFGCCSKTIHARMREAYPELRVRVTSTCGTKPRDLPLHDMASDIFNGMSLGQCAKKYGCAKTTVMYRLKKFESGKVALQAARERAILRPNFSHPFAVHIATKVESERTSAIRGR